MEEKLKLVRELIPWSLVAKGVLFGVSWLVLPYSLFFLVALFLFFSPAFQAVRFFPIFLFIVGLSAVFVPGLREGVFLSVLFVSALGIKNLIFVDRTLSSQVFLTASSLLLWLFLFSQNLQPGVSFLLVALGIVILFFLLFHFIFQLRHAIQLAPTPVFLMILYSLLSFEMAWVLVLLPALPIVQAIAMALFTAFFTEFFISYLRPPLVFSKIRLISGGFALTLVIVILSLPFSLTP